MGTIINIGTINNNNSRNLTINGNPANVSEIINSFFHGRQPEDIQAEEVTTQAESDLPYLVREKLDELNLYTVEQFADMYRKAAESDAKTFATFLKKYRDLKVLNFQDNNKKEIFATLRNYFPTMRQYGYDNFVAYY